MACGTFCFISLACGTFFSLKFWPAAHAFHVKYSSSSFGHAFFLKFLVLSTNSLVVKMIQEKCLREALLLT